MNEAIKAILYEMPSYLFNLVRLLTGPAKYISGIEFKEETKLTNITRALTFVCISYILSEVLASINLSARLNPNISLYAYYATSFVISAIAFIGFFIALVAAIRVAGGDAPMDRFFVVHAYYFGVLLVLVQALGSIAEGWLKFDQRWRRTEQAAAGTESTVYLLLGFAGVIAFIWGVAAWGAYAKLGKLTAGRSAGAMTLSLLFSLPVLALSFFMTQAYLPLPRPLPSASQSQYQPPLALPAASQPSGQAVPVSQVPKYSGPLIGAWAHHGWSLEESYVFRENGTFRHVLVGSGRIVSGGVVCEGTFTINRNVLILRVPPGRSTRGTETEPPPCNEVDKFKFSFENRNTLVLDGVGGDTFERVK